MASPKSVSLFTLGCKLNFSESSAIGRSFQKAGYGLADFEDGADIYVINTCSVTDFADRKCRKIIRRARRLNPDALVVVTGCYAQLKPDEIAGFDGVDLVLGAAEKFRIVEYVNALDLAGSTVVKSGSIKQFLPFETSWSQGDRTRAFLKVQDGCDYKCSFCTIPLARGKSRSDSISNIVNHARKLGEEGIREIVLTGVNIGDFREPGPEKEGQFIDLIQELDQLESIDRFRISSIEPNLCSDEIIEFVASSRHFMPHFHMPLQSGNNKQLRQMRRRYRRELYADRVEKIKNLMPHACIGVDIIVGFPGETEADFEETYRFINELEVSYLHVFTYSERSNTLAADMPGSVDMGVRKERNQRLRMLSNKKKNHFYRQFEGQYRQVLLENSPVEGHLSGFTDNYLKVLTRAPQDLVNSLQTVHLKEASDEHFEVSMANSSSVIPS
ncbi:MAG: tRNA (N(6)-L-threonylcarbamoyladenosine(37)-C(2))-methylthiotransferase MtaB [Saprospirales bacterium]|nr:MAG: tRNA (N(6)-L-threonylcarbamoyladenosine(37)-C(2))-methylthiotransferase MtaB [Saprospirales bacterium]